MSVGLHLRSIAHHNAQTLRHTPLAELSGSLGDLGTLLPLMIAMAMNGSINLSSTLVYSGLANIVTGAVFGIPLPVQPMKAIAAVAISQHFSQEETAAAGLTVAFAVLFLSATGLLRWLNKVVPVAVVKGIQVGAGLSLAISAGSSLIKPLGWHSPFGDNRIWAIAAFALLVFAALAKRFPYALVVVIVGVLLAGVAPSHESLGNTHHAGIWRPRVFVPSGEAWRTGAVDAAIGQLPLTTLNSILAVTSLSASLFSFPSAPSTTALGFSVAISNIVGCWFGAMPVCHGSGGLAGQYRFGARSGASIIILGSIKLILGLFTGEAIVPMLQQFPKSLLGIMVLAAGVELAKVGQSVSDTTDLWEQAEQDNDGDRPVEETKRDVEQKGRDRWMVMLITAAGCLAFKNDAVGFIAGLSWHWSLSLPGWIEKLRHGGRSIRLRRDQEADDGEDLLSVNNEALHNRLG